MPLAPADEYSNAARVRPAVLAFRTAWPPGLAVFTFLEGCGRTGARRQGTRRSRGRWPDLRGADKGRVDRSSSAALPSSSHEAFGTCRTVGISGLEVQEKECRAFLNRLCLARDQQEFDRVVAEQRHAVSKRPVSKRFGS